MDETRKALAKAVEIVRETRDEFLSEEYAVGQPAASFLERFACNQAASAIENEFGLGTMEQCALLGKPTPFQVIEITEALKPFAAAVEGCIDEDDQDRWVSNFGRIVVAGSAKLAWWPLLAALHGLRMRMASGGHPLSA